MLRLFSLPSYKTNCVREIFCIQDCNDKHFYSFIYLICLNLSIKMDNNQYIAFYFAFKKEGSNILLSTRNIILLISDRKLEAKTLKTLHIKLYVYANSRYNNIETLMSWFIIFVSEGVEKKYSWNLFIIWRKFPHK